MFTEIVFFLITNTIKNVQAVEKSMNKTQISKKLKDSVFAPNKPGPLKIIADVGNSDYYITRAIELLRRSEVQASVNIKRGMRIDAISLIALARVLDE